MEERFNKVMKSYLNPFDTIKVSMEECFEKLRKGFVLATL